MQMASGRPKDEGGAVFLNYLRNGQHSLGATCASWNLALARFSLHFTLVNLSFIILRLSRMKYNRSGTKGYLLLMFSKFLLGLDRYIEGIQVTSLAFTGKTTTLEANTN